MDMTYIGGLTTALEQKLDKKDKIMGFLEKLNELCQSTHGISLGEAIRTVSSLEKECDELATEIKRAMGVKGE